MIIDAHHHLWDLSRRTYPWLIDPAFAAINRSFTLDDFLRALTDQIPGSPAVEEPPWLRISLLPAPSAIRTILVQATSEREETVDLLATAMTSGGVIAGVIGWVDLAAQDVADQVAALREAPGGHLLVGLRHPVNDEQDPAWLARPEVMRGLRTIGEAGLTFDLLITTAHVRVARQVAERIPEVTFVLDHLAFPPIATGAWQPWASGLSALAEIPNVCAKLSGLVTADRWEDWETEYLLPYTMLAFEVFGPHRMMFGSDWPICRLSASYPETLAVAEQCTAQLSPPERRAFFSDTARRVYALA